MIILRRLTSRGHLHHVVGLRLAGQDALKVIGPDCQGVPLLRIIAVAVVDRGHARLDVVQNLRDDQPIYTKCSHAGGGRPP